MTNVREHWNQRYQQGNTPWDTGVPSRELVRVLDAGLVKPSRAIELGCGNGANAIELARRDFQVTAVDFSAVALGNAQQRAADASVDIEFVAADVCDFQYGGEPFDFVFDRGCYHAARRVDVAGFLDTLTHVTAPGTIYLMLAGNANESIDTGIPRVHESDIRNDLESLFDFKWLQDFRFHDAEDGDGPLGWSCLMTRRDGETPLKK